jgi:hypothetical protein
MAIMRCRQVKGMLPAHFNKELSEADRHILETHLAACSSCHTHWRNLYRAEVWLVRASQQTPVKRGPSGDFTASVMASIVARQQQSAAGQQTRRGDTSAQHVQYGEGQAPFLLPFGPWFNWEASPLGIGTPSTRMLLSSALLILLPVMVGVIAFGVLLTQPALASLLFVWVTTALANVVAGLYSFIGAVSTLADNQLLLAGVAVGYVALAVLWFRLMRHPSVGREEVES